MCFKHRDEYESMELFDLCQNCFAKEKETYECNANATCFASISEVEQFQK